MQDSSLSEHITFSSTNLNKGKYENLQIIRSFHGLLIPEGCSPERNIFVPKYFFPKKKHTNFLSFFRGEISQFLELLWRATFPN
jgi:hypothetical protein